MDRLAYTALSGVLAQGYVRTQLAHELSNVSTPGFKKGGGATLEFREVIGEGFPTRYQPVNNMADGSVDLSPIVVYLGLWFIKSLLIEYWPRY